jgi:hypothetical protein
MSAEGCRVVITGIVIAPGDFGRIFEPFYRAQGSSDIEAWGLVLTCADCCLSLRKVGCKREVRSVAGMFGATYVLITILAISKLSVATVTTLVVAGQMLLAVVLDHSGFLDLRRGGVAAPLLSQTNA